MCYSGGSIFIIPRSSVFDFRSVRFDIVTPADSASMMAAVVLQYLLNGRTAFSVLPFGSLLCYGNYRKLIVFIDGAIARHDNVLGIELDDLHFERKILFLFHFDSPLNFRIC